MSDTSNHVSPQRLGGNVGPGSQRHYSIGTIVAEDAGMLLDDIQARWGTRSATASKGRMARMADWIGWPYVAAIGLVLSAETWVSALVGALGWVLLAETRRRRALRGAP